MDMDEQNKELLAKLQEYKDSMSSRMADQLDSMITSNRENIRMKCLEAALNYCEITKTERVTRKQAIGLAEEFYKFVKGE